VTAGPAVAVSQLMAPVGAQIAHRTAARDDDVAGAALRPRAAIGRRAHARAQPPGLGQRQHVLDHGPVVGVQVLRRRFENEINH